MSGQLLSDTQQCLTACDLVERAVKLEENYKQMLLQDDEVNLRIQLWRKALEICKTRIQCERSYFKVNWEEIDTSAQFLLVSLSVVSASCSKSQ
jgi:hypothetical protein